MHKKEDRLFKESTPIDEFHKIFKRYTNDDIANFFNSTFFNGNIIERFGGLSQLENLERDAEVSSAIEKRRAALASTQLVIDHDSPSIKKFFEDQILPWENELTQGFFLGVEWGYSVTQIIYNENRSCKVDGYQIEDPWNFIPEKDLLHFSLWSKPNELLPYGKWVGSYYGARQSRPQGLGLYERLLIPYVLKCKASELWDFYLKRFAGGFITAQTEFKSDLEELREGLDRAQKMGSIVTTKETDISSLGFSGDANAFMMRNEVLTKSIQKIVLGETQTSDQGSVGSSFSAKIHDDVRWEKTLADMKVIKSAYQSLVEQIAYVCQATPDQIPKVDLILDQGMDLEKLDADVKLNSLGVRFNKKYFISNYNLKEDEFDIADPSQMQPSLGLFNKFSGGKSFQFANDPDDIAEFGQDHFALPISPDDLESAVLSASDKADLTKKLMTLYDNTDLTFVENFAEMLYSAAASGALKGIPVNKKIEYLPADEQKKYL